MNLISNKIRIRVNNEIIAKEVRLISADSNNLGVISLSEALRIAAEDGLDVVEVSPEANPPVCKIMDYGKYKYQKSKREHDSKKHQKIIHIKEIKLRPCTGVHDYNFKLKHAQKFLQQGNKVKITVTFRGREASHMELGNNILSKVAEDTNTLAEVELAPKREGRNMVMILAPKSHSGGKNTKEQTA